MARLTYEQERYEEDRLDLLHKIIFKAELEKWEDVEKYEKLYRDIYGALPTETNEKETI